MAAPRSAGRGPTGDANDNLVMDFGFRPVIAMDLGDLITSAGHEVCGMETTASGAVATAKRERPDLVLADIQLADNSSGIDAVKEILTSFNVPVIFITAHDAPAAREAAAASGAVAYLTKPVDDQLLVDAIGRAMKGSRPRTIT